jgi:galactose mutarotase-like enzyme
MERLENDVLLVEFDKRGAELQRIFRKDLDQEYLWNGDPAYWAKRSPILFPIVGTLKGDTYFYEGKSYRLGRHGFARDMDFEPSHPSSLQIDFMLKSSATSLQHYPFAFELTVSYALEGNALRVSYRVKNPSTRPMYFSVGGHPAFRLPLAANTRYDDYYLDFNEDEVKPRWPITKEGLVEKKSEPLLQSSHILPLSKEMFFRDALVLKYLTSSLLSLKSDLTDRGLDVNFGAFPFLGLWAAKNADFLCIEPWAGIADSVDSNQELVEKEGIQVLDGQEDLEFTWVASFY